MGTTTSSIKSLSYSLVFKNSGTVPLSISLSSLEASNGFTIKINRCGTSLAAKKSCEVVIGFSSRSLYNGTYNDSLVLTSGSVSLSTRVKAIVTESPLPNEQDSSISSVVTSLSNTLKNITLTNNGPGLATDISFAMPVGFSLFVNRCPSTLNAYKSCSVQVKYFDRRATSLPENKIIGVSYKGINIDKSASLDIKTGLPATAFQLLPEELQLIVTNHSLWLSSNEAEGERFHYYGPILKFSEGNNPELARLRLELLFGAKVNLSKGNFDGATAYGLDISGVNLSMAQLTQSNFIGANLNNSDLSGASLEASDLTGATLSGTNLAGATYNDSTSFPVGFGDPVLDYGMINTSPPFPGSDAPFSAIGSLDLSNYGQVSITDVSTGDNISTQPYVSVQIDPSKNYEISLQLDSGKTLNGGSAIVEYLRGKNCEVRIFMRSVLCDNIKGSSLSPTIFQQIINL